MQEIFKTHTNISKELFTKIVCFEKLRKEFNNAQTVKTNLAQSIIKSTRDIMNSSELSSFNKMEKISQQEVGNIGQNEKISIGTENMMEINS